MRTYTLQVVLVINKLNITKKLVENVMVSSKYVKKFKGKKTKGQKVKKIVIVFFI